MAEASSLVEKIDQTFLECGICLSRFRNPRGLPCLHSFCHECLERWCRGKKQVTCPNCKKLTAVPEEGVSGFPAHFMVNSLQETLDMEKLKLLLLGQADKALEETEWLIARMKGDLSNNTTNENTDVVGSTQMEDEEKAACSRLGTLVNAFQEIIQSAIPAGACTDASLKVLTRLYNALTLLTKYYLALYTQQSGHMSPRFEKLVKLFASNLSKHAYSMITYVQAIQSEKLSRIAGGGKGGKAKDKKKNDDGHGGGGDAGGQTSGKARMVMKESRSIPNLVFAIEQMERFLIRLTKKSKVDLMQHIKASTARDFRINAAVLQAALEEQELSSDEDSSGGEDNEDQENQEPAESQEEPASKKSKTEGKPNKLASKRGKKTATK